MSSINYRGSIFLMIRTAERIRKKQPTEEIVRLYHGILDYMELAEHKFGEGFNSTLARVVAMALICCLELYLSKGKSARVTKHWLLHIMETGVEFGLKAKELSSEEKKIFHAIGGRVANFKRDFSSAQTHLKEGGKYSLKEERYRVEVNKIVTRELKYAEKLSRAQSNLDEELESEAQWR